MKPKVSIIMGIYNCQDTIRVAINSIINQSYKNWELIMCDDGSTDRTYEIAKDYEDIDNRIKVLKNDKNKGLAYSLNKCIEESSGEYIARHDADDYSKKNRLEIELKFLDNNKEYGFVSSGVYLFDDKETWGERGIEREYTPTKYDLVKRNRFAHPTVMIRRDVLNKVENYTVDKKTYRLEDYDLWFKIYSKNIKGVIIPDKLYYFREDRNSYSRKKFKYRVDEMKVRLNGYKLMNIEKKYYIYSIRPILVGLIPINLLRQYHRIMARNRFLEEK